jgi:ribosomal protein S18 acetylase RimI-like enzyme
VIPDGPQPAVLASTDTDAHLATSIVARAFHSLAVAEWIVDDPADRARVLYANFRLWIDHAVQTGRVWMTHDRHAVAVWLPHPTCGIEDYEDQVRRLCGTAADRLFLLDEVFAKNQPAEPHWDLMFLATTGFARDQGRGTALLDQAHSRLDLQRLAATLVAASRDSRRLYQRHGYHDSAEPIRLPDGPCMFPMRRDPYPTVGPS